MAAAQLWARSVVMERAGSQAVGRYVAEDPLGARNVGAMSKSVYAAPFSRFFQYASIAGGWTSSSYHCVGSLADNLFPQRIQSAT
ncbi:hypothetical protein D9613_012634 [Agrocybe pediades]|uniref:Uncharacterized protein n=1 Tax=Agrocybe pediades TaxID=84607 RepID=A0A8H4QV48_9AGAR|nr:hypothetical protein D9613_012634 [Agrocybe pediades]